MITRRKLISSAPLALAAAGGLARRLRSDPLMRMTPAPSSDLLACHLGYLPDARKLLIVRTPHPSADVLLKLWKGSECLMAQASRSVSGDLGCIAILDFSSVVVPGQHRAVLDNGQQSITFQIASGIWSRTLPVIRAYHKYQRCGVAVPGVHPACHLDDGRRRDTGAYVNTAGGWHDAGDTRKWTDATLMNLFGLLSVARNRRASDPDHSDVSASLEEARYGNEFFLKMQDVDGLVWADVGGGIEGDNSDNHWTDNRTGTADDRWINTQKRPDIQAMFIAAQAMCYQVFRASDPAYAGRCLTAAQRCWAASQPTYNSSIDLAWWTMAAIELLAAVPNDSYRQAVIQLADQLRSVQFSEFRGKQDLVRGFFPKWPGNDEPLRDPVHPALPAYALLRAAIALNQNAKAKVWTSAVRLYLDEYVKPMVSRSGYRIVPFGLFKDNPTADHYRPFAGSYTFRYFMPVTEKQSWAGLNSHLLSHALLLAEAARFFSESTYRDLAYAQLEWILGANPFSASLITGFGLRNPPPFSRFVGPIPGGVMNGICGNQNDEPILDQQNASTWQTNEYWSPQVGYLEWTISVLESTELEHAGHAGGKTV